MLICKPKVIYKKKEIYFLKVQMLRKTVSLLKNWLVLERDVPSWESISLCGQNRTVVLK